MLNCEAGLLGSLRICMMNGDVVGKLFVCYNIKYGYSKENTKSQFAEG